MKTQTAMETLKETPPILPPKTTPRSTTQNSFYISSPTTLFNNAKHHQEDQEASPTTATMISPITAVNISVAASPAASPQILADQPTIPPPQQLNGNTYGTTVFVQSKDQVQDHTLTKSGHVVTIRINNEQKIDNQKQFSTIELIQNYEHKSKGANKSIVNLNNTEMKTQNGASDKNSETFYFGDIQTQIMSSGQCSPSDTLDSGTCSDLDSTPPPLPKKKNFKASNRSSLLLNSVGTDSSSEETESNVSCDSLNSTELNQLLLNGDVKFPINLLQDIRDRNGNLKDSVSSEVLSTPLIDECTYEDRQLKLKLLEGVGGVVQGSENKYLYDTDRFYKFHLNEHFVEDCNSAGGDSVDGNVSAKSVVDKSDESFAGYKDLLSGSEQSSTIRSAKGTIRGVKNRVRAGIATFLQIQQTTNKVRPYFSVI